MREASLRVAVVGGGVAGMATALGLADRGHQVRLLERRPFLGGRVFSFRDGDLGRGLDNGQHAMLGCYHETLSFLERIGAAKRLYWHGLRMELRDSGRRGVLDAGSAPAPFHLMRALLGYRLLPGREKLVAMMGAARLLVAWRRGPERFERRTVRAALVAVGQGEPIRRRLWDPITIAALNADPSHASAALFAAVLERAFFGRARDAAIVLPGAPLSEVFGEPGTVALEAAGVALCRRDALATVELDDAGRVAAVRTRTGQCYECDAVVLALTPRALGELSIGGREAHKALGAWIDDLSVSSPIVSTHVPLDRPIDLPVMIGLLGTTTQWVFHTDRFAGRSGGTGALLSCVTSDAASLDSLDDRTIARRVVAELQEHVPEVGRVDPENVRVVRERHATIPATVEATAVRPGTKTGVSGLFLAGDWVRTGLPATLESAAVSARLAVDAVEAHRPARASSVGQGRAA